MKKETLQNIALFIFCLIFIYVLAAFSVFEAYEGTYSSFFSGSLTSGKPMTVYYYLSFYLISAIYLKAYSIAPKIPWYEIIQCFFTAVALFVILKSLLKNAEEDTKSKKLILVALSLIIATEFILPSQYTRNAFALGIASTLALMAIKDNKMSVWSCILYVLCLLMRHEVGVFIIIIQWLSIIFISNGKYSKTALAFNTAVLVFMASYIAYDRFVTTDFLKQFEPELGFQLLDRKNIVPLGTMKTAVDSAKYIAVTKMINDPGYTTIPFIRSLVAENAFIGINKELVVRAQEILADKLNHSLGLLIIYFGILLVVIRQAWAAFGKKAVAKIIAFNLFIWSLIAIITFLLTLQYHTLDSMLSILCFILLSRVQWHKLSDTRAIAWLSCAIIVIGTTILTFKQSQYITKIKKQLDNSIQFREDLEHRYAGKIIIPGVDQKKKLIRSFKMFHVPTFPAFAAVYLVDADVTYIQADYSAFLSEKCKCNTKDYTQFFDFLASKGDSVRIISTHERMADIMSYCRVVRNKNYNLVAIDSMYEGQLTTFTFK